MYDRSRTRVSVGYRYGTISPQESKVSLLELVNYRTRRIIFLSSVLDIPLTAICVFVLHRPININVRISFFSSLFARDD